MILLPSKHSRVLEHGYVTDREGVWACRDLRHDTWEVMVLCGVPRHHGLTRWFLRSDSCASKVEADATLEARFVLAVKAFDRANTERLARTSSIPPEPMVWASVDEAWEFEGDAA